MLHSHGPTDVVGVMCKPEELFRGTTEGAVTFCKEAVFNPSVPMSAEAAKHGRVNVWL